MNIDVDTLQKIIDDACAANEEDSCQLAIYKSGIPVVDICAGENIKTDTLFPIFSSGKGVISTLAHILYEEGKLDFDAPVSKYWHNFRGSGKENIKVWMVFSHRTGLHNMPALNDFNEQCDWQKMVRYMEESVPVNEPGGICNYQGLTFSWLAGEIISQAGGKSFNELLREKITAPLGIEDEFYFGTTAEAEKNIVLPSKKTYWHWFSFCQTFIGNPAIRAACIPAANGMATARALAKIYAALSGRGVDGIRLLKDETIRDATRSCRADSDPLPDGLGAWAHFGLGYALSGPSDDPGAIFGHGGALGAEGLAIPQEEIAIGFTKNRILDSHPIHPVRDRISEALGIKIRHW